MAPKDCATAAMARRLAAKARARGDYILANAFDARSVEINSRTPAGGDAIDWPAIRAKVAAEALGTAGRSTQPAAPAQGKSARPGEIDWGKIHAKIGRERADAMPQAPRRSI